MRVFKWTRTFTPSQESSIVQVWVSFPELPAHLFHKDVLFTVASMSGTPLQTDDGTLNQSKLSKARTCIELDFLKPRLEEFKIQIFGETIVQRNEYEQIPHYCSLCKHVGHRDSECYLKGNAPKPHLPENRANVLVMTLRKEGERRTDYVASVDSIFIFENAASKLKDHMVVHENVVSIDVADTTCVNDKMGDENLEYKVADGNWTHVENAIMLLEQNTEEDQNSEEGEIMDSNARPLKICDPICLTNRNPVDTESVEQLLQELATPTRLPKNQFPMNEQSDYLFKNSKEKNRVMKQRSNSYGPRIRTRRIKKRWQ
ncbi:UNVERIFIED_CONTAM: hypothetical protein Sindi_1292200 [Sesamum indicum]